MNTNRNKISIKIIGEQTRVLTTLEKIESIFPLSVKSKIMENDDGINVHCWLTVAVEAYPAKSQPQQATTTPHKPLVEAVFDE
jgi:hypothetical protein